MEKFDKVRDHELESVPYDMGGMPGGGGGALGLWGLYEGGKAWAVIEDWCALWSPGKRTMRVNTVMYFRW